MFGTASLCWRVIEYEGNPTVAYTSNVLFVDEREKCIFDNNNSNDSKLKKIMKTLFSESKLVGACSFPSI